MKITAIKTRVFKENESLKEFIAEHITSLPEKSVLAITSKVVALAEGRTALAATQEEKEQLIKNESEFAVNTKYVWLTVKDGMVLASAGIDESNADGKLVLLPKDSYKAALQIRDELMEKFKVKKLGIVITDSRVLPLRAGATGIATGYAGFKGLKDYKGRSDIFGREFVFETSNIADSLATAAVLQMGEGAEQKPLALIEAADIEFVEQVDPKELLIDPEDDLYRPVISLQ